MVFFWSYYGLITELLRSYIYFRGVGGLGSGLARVCWLCGMEEVKPEPKPCGRDFAAGVFLLGSCVLARVLEEVKQKSPAQEGRFAVGVFLLGSCVLARVLEEVKQKSPTQEGQPVTKIPKVPIAINDSLGVQTTPVILHGSNQVTKL